VQRELEKSYELLAEQPIAELEEELEAQAAPLVRQAEADEQRASERRASRRRRGRTLGVVAEALLFIWLLIVLPSVAAKGLLFGSIGIAFLAMIWRERRDSNRFMRERGFVPPSWRVRRRHAFEGARDLAVGGAIYLVGGIVLLTVGWVLCYGIVLLVKAFV
jgi:hypothetical protein